jgi:cytochrome c oxidase subunit 3
MAGAKNHDYHILPPSITPILGSFAALTMFFGLVMWMHPEQFGYGSLVFGLGLLGVLYTFFAWWSDVVTEAHAGDHTPVVQLHLRYGMIMFIASEVMFFVGWFWAWFDFSLFPVPLEIVKDAETHAFTVTNLIGQEGAAALMQWPPKGLEVLDSMKLPLLNTLILLCSGTTVTWAHHALIHGDREA